MPFTAIEARALVSTAQAAFAAQQAAIIAALATKTTSTNTVSSTGTITPIVTSFKKNASNDLPTLLNKTEASIKSIATQGNSIYNLYCTPPFLFDFRVYFESQGYTVTAITGNNVNTTFFNAGVSTLDNVRVTW
jgi:hypothetical protein